MAGPRDLSQVNDPASLLDFGAFASLRSMRTGGHSVCGLSPGRLFWLFETSSSAGCSWSQEGVGHGAGEI